MGKLGPRLGTKKHAKRWAKGQSSSSNPETTKFREQANCMFFKESTGNSGITEEDLKKHDAIQGIGPRLESLDIDEHDEQIESTIDGSANTYDTFASDYSNCTNISFNRFLSHFQSKSILHKEMLGVLAAVTDIIKNKGGSETSTEYFAALMCALEALDTEMAVAASLSLLGMSIRTVPKSVLNLQFGQASKVFIQILEKYAATDNFLILRHCIGCLSLLLRAQEAMAWTNSSTLEVWNAILSFTIHAKPKVRKAAQHGICVVLKGSDIMRSENPPPYHPAASQVAKHCTSQLYTAGEPGGITTVLHTLALLKDIVHQLPKSHVKTICEALLSIMGLKNILVTSCCLQTLHGLFISRPSEVILPSERNAQIITALYDYQPPPSDTQPTLAWLAVMQEAHCNLAQNSLNLSATNIPRIFEKCIELWLSDKSEIISATSHTIKTILLDCVGPLCENEENTKRYKPVIDQVINMLHEAMSYQYLEAWCHVLHLIAVLFQVTGKTKNEKLLEILVTLAELRDSYNFSYNTEAEYAIGSAIRAMGPDIVIKTLPLMDSTNVIDMKRTWLLTLLKDCITHGSISFFLQTLLPLSVICEAKAKEPVVGKPFEFLIPQIWAILPSLCNNASDVKDSFKSIAKLLGTAINVDHKKELRIPVMASLRRLITKAGENDNGEDLAELARFGKNYLPILFNVYTTKPNGTDEEGQRLAAFDTIKVYLTIADKELIGELFDRALGKLKEPDSKDEFHKESLHDLIRILTEYTDKKRLKTFYHICTPFIKNNKKPKEQKKAYRFIEELCASDTSLCQTFILENRSKIEQLFISSATSTIKTSRGARLRCLIHLVNSHPRLEKTEFLKAIIPEAVLCVRDLNERCRSSAYQLLNTIISKFLKHPENLKEYMDMLMVGIGGEPSYSSATLLALASITYQYNGALGMETVKEILGHACTLALCPTREIVESALSYIKVYITVIPNFIIESTLIKIVKTLCEMNEDCKRHFRRKVRDIFTKLIRKHGIKTISGMVPVSDLILHKRLKNINKIEEVKKKNKKMKQSKHSDNDDEFSAKRRPKSLEDILADSEEEFEGKEDNDLKKNKKRTSRKEAWIQENEENIIDLIDPSTARNITTTQPGLKSLPVTVKKTKDREFKTAPDGRLIISEEYDNNDASELSQPKNKKSKFPHMDSDDDYEDVDDDVQSTTTSKPVNRKRKYSPGSEGASLKSFSSSKYQAGGSGIHRSLKKSRESEPNQGKEYRARKAHGDVKKKGKPDPYAYLPLTRAVLNRRKKKKNAAKFQSVISGAKKGARVGMKNKRKNL